MLGFLDSYGGKERADTDSCCAKVVYLVDLQAGVYLAGACQYIIYAVGCDSIETAAKRVELDQVKVITGFYKVGC